MPEGVGRQARFPAGATIRFRTNTSRLLLAARSLSEPAAGGVDVYADGAFWRTAHVVGGDEAEVVCYDGVSARMRDIDLYLPFRQEVRIAAVGADDDADLLPPAPGPDRPMVLYGSSIAQGAGASRPGMGYSSIMGRAMGAEIVNLGFGGAGRAEPEVVDLVADVDARCVVLDLGKSYGEQSSDAYAGMLERLRTERPSVPVVCITPIFATRELHDAGYVDLSHHVREAMRSPVEDRIGRGDAMVKLVDGLELLGPRDSDGFSSDGVHPGDLGHSRIAERLAREVSPVLKT